MRLTDRRYAPECLALPSWVPPSGGLRIWQCGEHFDAVRISALVAPLVVAALKAAGECGPVLADPYSGSWHILLEPGTTQTGSWARHYGARVLRPGTHLTVPAADVTSGNDLHWHIPPGTGKTDIRLLARVLSGAQPRAKPDSRRPGGSKGSR